MGFSLNPRDNYKRRGHWFRQLLEYRPILKPPLAFVLTVWTVQPLSELSRSGAIWLIAGAAALALVGHTVFCFLRWSRWVWRLTFVTTTVGRRTVGNLLSALTEAMVLGVMLTAASENEWVEPLAGDANREFELMLIYLGIRWLWSPSSGYCCSSQRLANRLTSGAMTFSAGLSNPTTPDGRPSLVNRVTPRN